MRGGRPIAITRASIGRIDQVRRDPVWEGFAIGLLYGVVMRATLAAEACLGRAEPSCTIANVGATAGIGALIDFGIHDERTVYRAARSVTRGRPTMTLLRLSF